MTLKQNKYLTSKERVIVTQEVVANTYLLKAVFKEDVASEEYSFVIQKPHVLTEDHTKREIFLYLGSREDFDSFDSLRTAVTPILNYKHRDIQVDLKTFVCPPLNERDVLVTFYQALLLAKQEIYNQKSKNEEGEDEEKKIYLFTQVKNSKQIAKQLENIVSSINFAKHLQILPPNLCTSEDLATLIEEELLQYEKLKITSLDKEKITEKGMNLLLSVNRGSAFEPRLLVVEYQGNPNSKEKIALIGKGITFDSGGYNVKPGTFMASMKFDMSGTAIVAAVMRILAHSKSKSNVVALMPITDNKINSVASTPDTVWKSYNGKTVEVNNTDAEGRLVLADAITYAIRDCGATTLVTVATLTGAVLYALGTTYTGFWATERHLTDKIKTAAQMADELVWEMPFHQDFFKNFKDSKVADLLNTNYVNKAGSSCAAMFLKSFTEDLPFIHLDIAGTAYTDGVPRAPLIKTLTIFANLLTKSKN